MAITVKKYCEVCGKEIIEKKDIVYTCTEGLVEVKDGYFCKEHEKEANNGKSEISVQGLV